MPKVKKDKKQKTHAKVQTKHFNWSKIEEEILSYWQKNHTFEKSIYNRDDKDSYVFYDGPPFATGLPHYGHILTSTVKDTVPRYFTMRGKRVERVWGWDCHGLPVENIVEKELGVNSHKEIERLGISKFNQACRDCVLRYEREWSKIVHRIGRWIDFEGSYKTMDNDYIESVWWGFKQLYDKGLVFKDSRISLYCPRCATPLSNFEIAMDNSYQNVKEETVYVKFRLLPEDERKLLPGKRDDWPVYFLAWTTTPWTLIGNLALAVNPDTYYIVDKCKKHKAYAIMARDLLREFTHEDCEIANEFNGDKLIGLRYEKLFPEIDSEKKGWYVIGGDFVTIDEGTGIVHIAAYGQDDYEMIKKYDLPMIQHLDEVGRLRLGPKKWLKKWFKDLDPLVIEDLRSRNLLLKTESISHSYPFCWRCETPLYYAIQPAWFIKVSKLKKKMLKANENVHWYPDHLKHGRFKKGIETAPDWNITRSRYWGSPVPIWECKECQSIKVVGSVEDLGFKKTLQNTYYLLRHGEAVHNVESRVSCQPESKENRSELTAWGKEQIHHLVSPLKALKIDQIIASDLYRIKQTIDILEQKLKIPVSFDPRLREINLGVFNCAPIKEYYGYFKNKLDRFKLAPEGGENLSQVQDRMYSVIKDLEKKYKGKRFLIVSHGDPLWMLMAKIQNKGEKESFEMLYPRLGEIRRLREDPIDLHRPTVDAIEFDCEKCGGKMKRIPEVFDCWVESGSMPFAQIHYPFENQDKFKKNFPAEFISEYIAQTRGWFYTLHVLSVGIFSKACFKHVVTTGTVLAEDGSKMSKSKGNFPDPWLLLERYGADPLRMYLLTSSVMLSENLNFSERGVEEIYRKVILLLWNVYSFWEMFSEFGNSESESNFCPGLEISNPENILDRWIISKLYLLMQEVTKYMDSYDILRASRAFVPFIDELSTWYVRRSRDRFKHGDEKDRYQAIQTLGLVLFELSKILAPFTPFLAEKIYLSIVKKHLLFKDSTSSFEGLEANFTGLKHKCNRGETEFKESVHLCDWPEVKKKFIDTEVMENMDRVRKVVELALALRAQNSIKVRQPLKSLIVSGIELSKDYIDLIKDEVNVGEVLIENSKTKTYKKQGVWVEKEENNIVVALNIEISKELQEEGMYRDLVRFINALRKKAMLTIKDSVLLCCQTDDQVLRRIILSNTDRLQKDTIAKDIKIGQAKVDIEKKLKINGVEVWIGLKK